MSTSSSNSLKDKHILITKDLELKMHNQSPIQQGTIHQFHNGNFVDYYKDSSGNNSHHQRNSRILESLRTNHHDKRPLAFACFLDFQDMCLHNLLPPHHLQSKRDNSL